MDGFERITGREHDGLVEKCQENGWLKVGGFDWQDDPFLEEYPYEFSRTDSVDRLREALGSGNWAIRQGFCYRDLAFIQQVNGGDEWWTLKRDGDAWTGFESWSFGAIAQEPERFERAMRDMCEATPEQCRSGEWAHLHEKAPEPLAQRAASAREARRGHRGRGRADLREAQPRGALGASRVRDDQGGRLRQAARRVGRAPHHPRRGPRLAALQGGGRARGRRGLPPARARDGKGRRARKASKAHSQGLGRDRGPRQIEGPER